MIQPICFHCISISWNETRHAHLDKKALSAFSFFQRLIKGASDSLTIPSIFWMSAIFTLHEKKKRVRNSDPRPSTVRFVGHQSCQRPLRIHNERRVFSTCPSLTAASLNQEAAGGGSNVDISLFLVLQGGWQRRSHLASIKKEVDTRTYGWTCARRHRQHPSEGLVCHSILCLWDRTQQRQL